MLAAVFAWAVRTNGEHVVYGSMARLRLRPHVEIRRHLERFVIDGRRLHLLNRGSLVNLAAGLGISAPQLFDPFAALMLLGLDAILGGRTADLPAGVQRYPAELEARVARALVDETPSDPR